MLTDLIDKRTVKEKLLEFIREKKVVKTHSVIEWGLKNFTNRADRTARDLATEGKIRRMEDSQKKFLFPDCREDVWSYIPQDNDYLK